MSDGNLCHLTVHDLARSLQRRDLSPVEVVEAHLRRIEALNPRLSAFFTVTADRALAEARRAEAEIVAGQWRGPLHGIPYGAKDIIETAGILTTHGSSFFRDHVPAEDAECIVRLRRAGAIVLGKTLTHEFASAATTINPHYGTAHNPWRLERITGGSSGGSAAAVAAGLCPFALGSDTGGSIRNPAALCGIVGLKPTHGRVSLTGVCPNVLTFDHLGPMTRTARDAALVLKALAGYDPRDGTSRDVSIADYAASLDGGLRGLRLVLCPDFHGHAEVDAEVQRASTTPSTSSADWAPRWRRSRSPMGRASTTCSGRSRGRSMRNSTAPSSRRIRTGTARTCGSGSPGRSRSPPTSTCAACASGSCFAARPPRSSRARIPSCCPPCRAPPRPSPRSRRG